MALKDRGRRMSRIPYEQAGWGILEGFATNAPASLNPTITAGEILLPGGHIVSLVDGDFAFIGPANDGVLTASDRTDVFFSPSSYFAATGTAVPTANSGAIYSNLTGTKTNPNDIRLMTYITDATTVTGVVPGDWFQPMAILLGRGIDLTGTADRAQAVFPGINGRSAYCYGLCAVTVTSITGSTAIVDCQKLDRLAGTETSLGTVTLVTKTLDFDVLANVDWSVLTSYVEVLPNDLIAVEVTDAATAGTADIWGLFGGYPNTLYR